MTDYQTPEQSARAFTTPGGWGVLPAFVVADPRLSALQIRLLLCLSIHVSERDKTAWPSIARLAAYCGVTERTVQLAMAKLQKLELIESRTRTADSGATLSNRYSLRFDRWNKTEKLTIPKSRLPIVSAPMSVPPPPQKEGWEGEVQFTPPGEVQFTHPGEVQFTHRVKYSSPKQDQGNKTREQDQPPNPLPAGRGNGFRPDRGNRRERKTRDLLAANGLYCELCKMPFQFSDDSRQIVQFTNGAEFSPLTANLHRACLSAEKGWTFTQWADDKICDQGL